MSPARTVFAAAIALTASLACEPVLGPEVSVEEVSSITFASAQGAVLINFGRDGEGCGFSGLGFSGSGHITSVETSSGKANRQCVGTINETPPSRPVRIKAPGVTMVITPGGRFQISQHSVEAN